MLEKVTETDKKFLDLVKTANVVFFAKLKGAYLHTPEEMAQQWIKIFEIAENYCFEVIFGDKTIADLCTSPIMIHRITPSVN